MHQECSAFSMSVHHLCSSINHQMKPGIGNGFPVLPQSLARIVHCQKVTEPFSRLFWIKYYPHPEGATPQIPYICFRISKHFLKQIFKMSAKRGKAITIGTLIASVAIIVLAVIAYNKYIAPSIRNNIDQVKTVPFQEGTFFFVKSDHQEGIYSLELEINGSAPENFELLIGSEKNLFEQRALVKNNTELDYVFVSDWYADSCYLQIRPTNSSRSDSLEVHCRFISTN